MFNLITFLVSPSGCCTTDYKEKYDRPILINVPKNIYEKADTSFQNDLNKNELS